MKDKLNKRGNCQKCAKTYGALGCCSTMSNELIYNCEEGMKEWLRRPENALQYIHNTLPIRDLLEAAAEEAAEFSQASLKMIRAGHLSENRSPASVTSTHLNMREEVIDLLNCVAALYGSWNEVEELVAMAKVSPKWGRWVDRQTGGDPQ